MEQTQLASTPGRAPPPISARSETAASNGLFKRALAERPASRRRPASTRQAVPGEKRKAPYHLRVADAEVFGFAGIYAPPQSQHETGTYAIVTTTPNKLFESIHDLIWSAASRVGVWGRLLSVAEDEVLGVRGGGGLREPRQELCGERRVHLEQQGQAEGPAEPVVVVGRPDEGGHARLPVQLGEPSVGVVSESNPWKARPAAMRSTTKAGLKTAKTRTPTRRTNAGEQADRRLDVLDELEHHDRRDGIELRERPGRLGVTDEELDPLAVRPAGRVDHRLRRIDGDDLHAARPQLVSGSRRPRSRTRARGAASLGRVFGQEARDHRPGNQTLSADPLCTSVRLVSK
jgi:hypothetical protein